MKNIFKRLLLTTMATSTLVFSNLTLASDIEFKITGINSDNGKIYIQLFKGEENYKKGNAESSSIIKAVKGGTKIIFPNVSPGEYAVRFFHDENNNGELETNLFGLPVEGYGFSNNAQPDFGPVSYNEMKFLVSADEAIVKNQTTAIY